MSVTTHLNRRTALTVLLALGLVALSLAIQMAKPSKAQNQFAPSFKHVGAVGKPIQMREGTITVTKVRLAKSLESRGLKKESVETSGYWLLVDFTFVPVRESESMTMDLYTADNTKYPASLRPDGAQTSTYGEPGFKTSGVTAYEIPKQALPGSRVVIGNGGLFGVPLWDDEVVVPLGIDDARADRMVKDAPPSIVLGE